VEAGQHDDVAAGVQVREKLGRVPQRDVHLAIREGLDRRAAANWKVVPAGETFEGKELLRKIDRRSTNKRPVGEADSVRLGRGLW
jgi:hypothetical protein